TKRAAEAISADVYAAYRGALGYNHWMVQTLSSDEAVSLALGTDYYDGGRFRELHVHNWTPDNAILPGMRDSAMTGINLANNVLAIFEDDESQKAAPMRSMYTYFYFLVMDNFDDVPTTQEQMETVHDRSPRAEICRFS